MFNCKISGTGCVSEMSDLYQESAVKTDNYNLQLNQALQLELTTTISIVRFLVQHALNCTIPATSPIFLILSSYQNITIKVSEVFENI